MDKRCRLARTTFCSVFMPLDLYHLDTELSRAREKFAISVRNDKSGFPYLQVEHTGHLAWISKSWSGRRDPQGAASDSASLHTRAARIELVKIDRGIALHRPTYNSVVKTFAVDRRNAINLLSANVVIWVHNMAISRKLLVEDTLRVCFSTRYSCSPITFLLCSREIEAVRILDFNSTEILDIVSSCT